MKRLILAASLLSLTLGTAGAALAQSANDQNATPPTGNQDSAKDKTQHINSQDAKKGNDLNASKAPEKATSDSDPLAAARIKQQDTSTGNNLMANQRGATPYEQLDANNAGKITAQQAKNDKWLSTHFKACDTDHDQSVSKDEYAACTQKH